MVPNFMLLQSAEKSSKRTLSVSWKRLSSSSQSACRPGGAAMPAKPAHSASGPARGGRPGNPARTPRLRRRDTRTRSVTSYPGPLAPPPAGPSSGPRFLLRVRGRGAFNSPIIQGLESVLVLPLKMCASPVSCEPQKELGLH